MTKHFLMHTLLVVLVFEFGYVLLNYERITEGGIKIMLPNAFIFVGCLVFTGVLGIPFLLKTANQQDLPNLRQATGEEREKLKLNIPVLELKTDIEIEAKTDTEKQTKPFLSEDEMVIFNRIINRGQ